MTIYDRGRALAIRQLAPIAQGGKGQVVTLVFTPAGVVQPGGIVIGGVPITQTCSGVEKSIETQRIDGKNILEGDVEFIMSPVTTDGVDLQLPTVTPDHPDLPANSTLTLQDGSVWRVVRAMAKRPAGLMITATLQIRH